MLKVFFFACCVSFSNLTAELAVSLEEYAEMIGDINPATHRIGTLNNHGDAMCFTTELTETFLQDCRNSEWAYVLEVGCAYGIKASQIVQTGVFLDANDIDSRHLKIMENIFAQLSKTNPNFNNVRFLAGNITKSEIGNQKYDAILCESVLHFMRPDEVRKTLNVFHASLKAGGKVYITVLAPYIQGFRETFLINKARGDEWPGFFEDPAAISPILAAIHKPFNAIDDETLHRELKLAGFKVIKSKYIPKPFLEKQVQFDGRDWFIAIAEKE